ncbi:Ubiquitin-like-specific protease 1 [Tolypocladium capitatum]|uniref:Ubiquitin-like-specific protease 1 n=1 Tax=Tolypocladium capitatum TaxID=45235 RepID=A0A2K3QLM4_9HYPO|nr:Ubiquitin-like-specific protease 1 [Tolypocladium capitatum]
MTNAAQESRRMFGGRRFLGRITGMMSNAFSTVTGFGDRLAHIFRRTSYNVAELRSVVRVAHSELAHNHVANKRRKLTPPDASNASWVHEASFHNLVEANQSFLNNLRRACNIIASHPSRDAMNKLLQPLSHVLYKNPIDLQFLFSGEKDMCDAFLEHVENCIRMCNNIYEVGFFFKYKSRYPIDALDADYNFEPVMLEKLHLAQNFLSAAPFPTICNRILEVGNARPEDRVATEFIDRVILDLQALRINSPAPSFIVSETYHGQILRLFPPPVRTDLDLHLLLPGTFPEDEEPAPQDEVATPHAQLPGPVGSPPPAITKTDITKTARLRADFLESRIFEISPEEFRSEFYIESNAHPVIQENCVIDFPPKEPPNLAEAAGAASAHRNRPKSFGKTTSKRFKMSRLPKTVRFTESTLSPQSRTHTGLDVLRLLEHDGEPTEDETLANRLHVALQMPGTAETQNHPLTPRNFFSGEATQVPEDDELSSWLWTGRLTRPGEQRREAEVDPAVRIQEILDMPSDPGFAVSVEVQSLLERQKSEVARKAAEEARKAEEEARVAAKEARHADEAAQRAAEEQKRRELKAALSKARELRAPLKPLITPLSRHSEKEAYGTLGSHPSAILAKSGDNTELRRHDFTTVLPPTQWVNDEIINGSISWIDRAINEAAGIKDVKKQTRKSLALNSFFFKVLLEKGPLGTERTLRRCGVTKENMLDVDTIFLPICQNSHWTLLVVRPSKRTVAHMDSLNPHGSSEYTTIALTWVEHILGDKFDASEWKVEQHEAPAQTNGYDCGVFTITNAMCLALGLSPIDSYDAKDMPLQRIRIAAMLKNGGFSGEFDLGVY